MIPASLYTLVSRANSYTIAVPTLPAAASPVAVGVMHRNADVLAPGL